MSIGLRDGIAKKRERNHQFFNQAKYIECRDYIISIVRKRTHVGLGNDVERHSIRKVSASNRLLCFMNQIGVTVYADNTPGLSHHFGKKPSPRTICTTEVENMISATQRQRTCIAEPTSGFYAEVIIQPP